MDYAGFKFYQTELIIKLLEATGIHDCNDFTTHKKVQSPLGKYDNCPHDKDILLQLKFICNRYTSLYGIKHNTIYLIFCSIVFTSHS